MREIEFRGETAKGKLVYGYAFRLRKQKTWQILDGRNVTWKIQGEPAQLIGVDKNGVEVYEGDVLFDELEQEHIAEIYDKPNYIAGLRLKGAL